MTTAVAPPFNTKTSISFQGWMGIILAFSFMLSTSSQFRVPIGGVLVHLYLFILPVLVIIGGIRIFNIPMRLLAPLLLYTVFFSFPMILEQNFSEILKIVAGVITLLFFVQIVKSERDIEACSLGFIAVGVYLSIQVILLGQSNEAALLEGVNALNGIGNKNAQSLFILPSFFFIVFNSYNHLKKGKIVWVFFYVLISLPIIVGSALTGNRSGYVGLILILIILVFSLGFSLRPLIFLILILSVGAYLINEYAFSTISRKLNQTTSGEFYSDQLRKELIVESISLGFEHPFPGLGFKGLGAALATKANIRFRDVIDPHNLYGYLLGAGGILSFVFFFLFFYRAIQIGYFYNRKKKSIVKYGLRLYDKNIYVWFVGFIILFLFRSFFTREMIYSPSFMGSTGLLLGCILFYSRRLAKVKLQ